MSDNPYAPPQAEVLLAPAETDAPEAVLKKIRHAWIAGAVSTVATLLIALLAIFGIRVLGD